MKKVIIFKNILLVLLLLSGFSSFAQIYRQSKEITRVFKIENDTELKVNNKYGRIKLVSWDKDSVKFNVQIKVRNKKEEKAKEILHDIQIDFLSSKIFLESSSSFSKENSLWDDLKDKTSQIFSGDNKIQIDYEIYLPSQIAININNKYGDIFIDDHKGKMTINLSNGDLKAHNLSGETNIDLEFAYANIKHIALGDLKLGYRSEIRITTAESLSIDSRSSRINIGQVDKLKAKSHRDKYLIESVQSLNAVNSYTYLEIQSLEGNILIEAKYGDIDIKKIESNVSKLSFEAENTDINMIKPTDRSMEFEIIYDEKAGLFFPEELKQKTTIKMDEKEKLVKTTGSLGEEKLNPIDVKATLISGNIRVGKE